MLSRRAHGKRGQAQGAGVRRDAQSAEDTCPRTATQHPVRRLVAPLATSQLTLVRRARGQLPDAACPPNQPWRRPEGGGTLP